MQAVYVRLHGEGYPATGAGNRSQEAPCAKGQTSLEGHRYEMPKNLDLVNVNFACRTSIFLYMVSRAYTVGVRTNIHRSRLCDVVVHDLEMGDSLYTGQNQADSLNFCFFFFFLKLVYQDVWVTYLAQAFSCDSSQ